MQLTSRPFSQRRPGAASARPGSASHPFPPADAASARVARMLHWPGDGRTHPLALRGQVLLTAVEGQVWITRHGWPQDHWLRPGESLRLDAGSRWRRLRVYISGEGENGITLKLEPIV